MGAKGSGNFIKEATDQKVLIRAWIMKRDFFWLRELKEAFGVLHDSETKNKASIRIHDVLVDMREAGEIQCTEKRGSERQYYVTGN